ncbi:MAG: DciA family protein [Gammaproteobacteria bacterium]
MKSISNLLQPGLIKQARNLNKLEHLVHACLPDNCKQHVKIAGIKDNHLLLVVDSPVWSSRIRLYSNHILDMLKEQKVAEVQQIRIRLSQAEPIKPERVFEKRQLDEHSSKLIEQTADSIDDPALKQALHKLAANKKSN